MNGIVSECSRLQTQKHSVFRNSDVKLCLREQSMHTLRRGTVTLNQRIVRDTGPGPVTDALRGSAESGREPARGSRLRSPVPLRPLPGLSRARRCHPRHCKNPWNTETASGYTATENLTRYLTLKRHNSNSTRESTATSIGFFPLCIWKCKNQAWISL